MTALDAAGTVVLLALAAGLGWWAWSRARRRVSVGRWRLERAGLLVRSIVLPRGPRREIVTMRLALHDNLLQTQRVLRQPGARDAVPRPVRDLLPPLEQLAAILEGQLRLWQTEPDAALVLAALPELRDRGHTLIGQALAMRTSALDAIQEAGRLTRAPAEEHLRSHADALSRGAAATGQLQAPAARVQAPPPTIVESGQRR